MAAKLSLPQPELEPEPPAAEPELPAAEPDAPAVAFEPAVAPAAPLAELPAELIPPAPDAAAIELGEPPVPALDVVLAPPAPAEARVPAVPELVAVPAAPLALVPAVGMDGVPLLPVAAGVLVVMPPDEVPESLLPQPKATTQTNTPKTPRACCFITTASTSSSTYHADPETKRATGEGRALPVYNVNACN